jgi:site-specific DNA-methyltransferase (adenine-specific)
MIKIYCCDAIYYLQRIEDCTIDMVLVDPMNTKDPEFNAAWLKECHRVLKDSKILCSFCTPSTLDAFTEQVKTTGFTHRATLFRKNNITGGEEPCIIAFKGDATLIVPVEAGGREFKTEDFFGSMDIKEEERVEGFPFEAQKPLDMIKQIIKQFTKEGDLVLDFFLGSGTTALACKETGRNFKGCESNLAFAEVARKRLGFENLYTTGL